MQLEEEIDAPINELKILFKNVWTSQKNLIIHPIQQLYDVVKTNKKTIHPT
jgi:hypothetical protein